MTSNWDSFKQNVSVDESIISNPWENNNNSNNGKNNIINLVAPNPISPILSQKSQHDDVASIISSLNGVANNNTTTNNNNNLLNQSSFLGNYKQPTNLSVFDEAVMSDSGSDALRDAISAISAPVANQSLNKARFGSNLFGPASVSGVNVTNLKTTNSTSTFLEKFASVTEKTRELESKNNNNIGSRRSSIFNNEPKSPQQLFREPRKQSFSEKLESYISATASPNTSRHLSFSSEINNQTSEKNSSIIDSNDNNNNNTINWNPAAAATFHPNFQMTELSFMQQQSMMMSSFPIPHQNIPANAFFPQMFPHFIPQNNFNLQQQSNDLPSNSEKMKPSDTTKSENGSVVSTDNENDGLIENDKTDQNDNINQNDKLPEFYPIGLNRPISPYVIAPFNPYNMFNPNQIIPTPGSPINSNNAPHPMMISPQMMGMAPVGPRNDIKNINENNNIRSVSPPIKHSKSPISSNNNNNLPSITTSSSSSNKKNNNNNNNNNKMNKFKSKHIVRSPLLEEFRNNKDKKFTLKDITSHGYEFAKDQHGSRFIQQELSIASDEDKELFFKEIRTNSIDLMTDVFGNYVIQKYFEYGSDVQKKVLFELMRGSFNSLSLQMYGCRVVQKCLEGIKINDQLEIMNEIKPNILNLVKDQNGNHVIQKAIEKISIEKIPFILESLKHQIYHLSMHPYGCRVIQRLLECSNFEDQQFILNELKDFIYYLVQDQFGNYVIQHVIESGKKKDTDLILKVILDNLIELSKHKFASNAVEKCIINLPIESRNKIFETMLKDNLAKEGELLEQSNLMLMMKDPFANYVVQKMVELVDLDRKKLLIFKIKQYLKLIQKNSHGKHLASIEKLNHICRTYDV